MDFKKFGNKYIIRIDRGEELVSVLEKFCKDNDITLGTVHGIGASNRLEIGLFDTENKEYHSNEFTGDFELVPILGNISTMDGEIYLHLHANIADSENKSFGGHLSSAVISGTFEGVIEEIDGEVDREFNDDCGLNIFKFQK